MTITLRSYGKPGDFELVSRTLVQHYQPDNLDNNWLQPTWEYMHSHPMLDKDALHRSGGWEKSGEIVAVAHYESSLGEVFFELHPDYGHLKPELLDYAEANLVGDSKDRERFVHVFISDRDPEFTELVQSRGYQRNSDYDRPLAVFRIPNPFPEINLPAGYRLKSLAEENNLHKIHRALWRGFNHPGDLFGRYAVIPGNFE